MFPMNGKELKQYHILIIYSFNMDKSLIANDISNSVYVKPIHLNKSQMVRKQPTLVKKQPTLERKQSTLERKQPTFVRKRLTLVRKQLT